MTYVPTLLRSRRASAFALMALVASGLPVACGGGSDAPAPAPAPALTAAEACAAIGTSSIASSAISIPTTGATISSATLQAASGAGPTATGEYCKVLGAIKPIDRSAPPILFQVNLPTTWNGKAFQHTGGGYDGSLVNGTGGAPSTGGLATPLAKGYTTFGSDSGHPGNGFDASFGMNDEALENYFGDQLRKTRDLAVALMQTRYAKAPTKTYIAGGSGGGREALYAADRWPDVYDGVIAYYPAWSLTSMILNYGRISKALAAPGAWPNPAKQALVASAVTGACDALDGATDSIVSNLAACHFDPVVLRCPGGADTGDTCLSDAQIAGTSSYAAALALPFPLANGTNSYPAYNVFTGAANLGGPLPAAGTAAPVTPSTFQMPFAFYIYEPFVRYWVTRDADYDSLNFNATSTAYFVQRLQYISSRLDVRTDLSAFKAHGGKVIVVHGQADSIIPAKTTEDLLSKLTTSMGATTVSSFLKFYEVPGFSHGFGAFSPSWDSVSALEAWVEQGTAPVNQIATDTNPSAGGRTRPLCEYPTWPKYSGTGDINVAASYICSP